MSETCIPQAIVLSASIAAVVAIVAMWIQWRTAVLRSTLQFAMDREVHDKYWTQMRQEAQALLEDPAHDKQYWVDRIPLGGNDIAALRAFLNHYELVASGIRHKIIDGSLYAEWAQAVLVKNWKMSELFVDAVREVTGDDRALWEFQNLARKWES